ncbi:MAG: glycosyltransferase family protein [Candidatus Margulisbacteria bacterium]|nr:glycosyltransferase family protein [Candidatus Margulisiibacteriota bacterium]
MALKNKSPKIGIIVQARMSSTRLPGKVMLPLWNKPILGYLLDRISHCTLVNSIIVATSDSSKDSIIQSYCQSQNILCFRGNESDVLNRYVTCATQHQLDIIIRVTGDCPLMDPILINDFVTFFLAHNYDYVSNTIFPTYPDGLDIEIFTYDSLCLAHKMAKLPSEREHVTPFIKNHSDCFKLYNIAQPKKLDTYRLTLDEPEDWALIQIIYEQLYPNNALFTWQQIVAFLENNPEYIALNQHINRNEGYINALKKDQPVNNH